MTPIKKYYFLKEHFLSDRYKYIALICLVFLLSSAQICKKCTILSNLRIITQEKRKLDKLRHFFHQLLSSNCLRYSFLYLKIAKIHFHGVLLSSTLVCKIPEFWRCKLWDQNFVSLDSGNIHIKENKNQILLFLSSWEPNFSDLMVYFCLFQNAILHMVEAKVLKL